MSEQFKVGDVVKLKSGGPDMVVAADAESPLTPEGAVSCAWFVANDEVRVCTFTAATLEAVEQ